MNLVFVTSEDPSGKGGANIATAHIITALAQNPRVDLTIICPKPRNQSPFSGLDYVLEKAYFLPKRKPGRRISWYLGASLYMLSAFRNLVAESKCDAVLARLSPAMLVPPLVAKYLNVPYILLVRGMMVDNLRHLYAFPGIALWGEFVSWINARAATRVYAAFENVRSWIDDYRLSSQEGAQVLPNAADPALFQPISTIEARREIESLEESDYVIGFVGRLHARHGLVPLIQAFADFNEAGDDLAKLLIVGDGPQRPDLESLVRKKGVEKSVVFTGFVPHAYVPVYIAACDVLYGVVDPNLVSNPIKCYEYLACERPIITTREEPLKFVQDFDLGVVLDALRSDDIVKAVESLYTVGKKKREEMGKQGRQHIIEHHTWEQFAKVIIDDIEESLG